MKKMVFLMLKAGLGGLLDPHRILGATFLTLQMDMEKECLDDGCGEFELTLTHKMEIIWPMVYLHFLVIH